LKTLEISQEEFELIANRDESHFFDLKAKGVDGRGIQKIVVAFGNADGGEVVVGIKDQKETKILTDRWDGFTDLEAMNQTLQAVYEVKPAVTVQYEVLTSEFGQGYLLRLTVEKSSEVLTTSDGVSLFAMGRSPSRSKRRHVFRSWLFQRGRHRLRIASSRSCQLRQWLNRRK